MWLLNGRPGAALRPDDRGLAYGDGLFETIACADGELLRFDLHYARLAEGCRRLQLPLPPRPALRRELAGACAGRARAVVKLILTRGPGQRGYALPARPMPTRLVHVFDWPEPPARYYRDGVRLRVCRTCATLEPQLAGLKHLNRLPQVLARLEWRTPAIQEGLMLDPQGYLVGGTMSNLFLRRRGVLATPALTQCGVHGVMRRLVIERAQCLGLRVVERGLRLGALGEAEEVFVTNSLIGVWPVRRIDARRYRPGETARALLEELVVGRKRG